MTVWVCRFLDFGFACFGVVIDSICCVKVVFVLDCVYLVI